MGVAVAVVIGPHNGRAETVGLGDDGSVRHDDAPKHGVESEVFFMRRRGVRYGSSAVAVDAAAKRDLDFTVGKRSDIGFSI